MEPPKADCRYYLGYKPCGKAEACGRCPHYEPWQPTILIIKLAAMGDVLRTTPILTGLRQRYPDAHVTWITDPESIPLLRHNPLIHRLLPFAPPAWLELEVCEFDLLLNFEKETRALALAKRLSAKEKRGFGPSPHGTLYIFNEASFYALLLGLSDDLKFRQNTKTYPQIIFEMAELPHDGEEYILELSEEAQAAKHAFADRFGLDGTRAIVGLNTGCGTVFPTKQWTQEGFIGAIRGLAADEGVRCLLLGGPREREFNRHILAACGDAVIDTGCDNSLEAFLGLVDLCDVVVSADSMAMHVAIGRKKQVIALFGPTCEQEIDLFGRGEKILPDHPCLCCYRAVCHETVRCMETIAAEQVLGAVRRALQVVAKDKG